MQVMSVAIGIAITAALAAVGAQAQTVGSVFGPTIDPEDRAFEYRIGFAPGEDGEDDVFVHRLHYEQALNGALRLRGIVQGGDAETGRQEFNFVQGELLWQFLEETPAGVASALRFDLRLNEGDDRSHQFGVNLTNQWDLGGGWRLRGLLLADRDFGDRARDGVFLEARTSVTRGLGNGLRLGVETYNDFGNTDAGIGGFNEQEHLAGPVISGGFGEGWGWFVGALFGVSDAANDTDLQFRIGRDF